MSTFSVTHERKKLKAQTGLKQNVPWVDEAPKASIHL